jgi:hypothetical protein
MKKILFVFLFCALSLMCNAQVKTYRLGNLTVGNPYHDCVSTLCYQDSVYKFVVIGKGEHETWGFDLADNPQMAIAVLQGIIDSYYGADTIWIDNYTIECEKDLGFYVAEPAPGRELPDGTTFWFSIDNMKKDIKALRKIESGKLTMKDRRQYRKIIKQAKKRAKEA